MKKTANLHKKRRTNSEFVRRFIFCESSAIARTYRLVCLGLSVRLPVPIDAFA